MSSDVSIAAVNPTAVMSEDGSVNATVVGLSGGTTAVTAYTPNGLKAVYQINVKETDAVLDDTDDGGEGKEEPAKPKQKEEKERGVQNPALITAVCIVIIIVAVGALVMFLRKKK